MARTSPPSAESMQRLQHSVCLPAAPAEMRTMAGALPTHGGTMTTPPLLDTDWLTPYASDEQDCGQSFAEEGKLKRQKLTHTDERPWACEAQGCGKSFARKRDLASHKLTHIGERPFACEAQGCGQSFARKTRALLEALGSSARRHLSAFPVRPREDLHGNRCATSRAGDAEIASVVGGVRGMAGCPEASKKNYPKNSDLGARRYRGARRQLRTPWHASNLFDCPSAQPVSGRSTLLSPPQHGQHAHWRLHQPRELQLQPIGHI